MIKYTCDDAGYHSHDTETGITTSYKTQAEWVAASLTVIGENFERMIERLDNLERRRSADPQKSGITRGKKDPETGEMVPSTVWGEVHHEIPVWP